jgi:glycosyltransferase involved in cell wall biosynthesis
VRVAIDGLLLGGRHSGVERAIEQMAAAVAKLGGVPELGLVCKPAYAERAAAMGFEPLIGPSFVRWRGGRILFEQVAMSRWLRRHGWDVLHGPGYIIPRNFGGPTVVTVYDLIALEYPQWCKRSNVAHFRLTLPASIRAADIVVVPSQTVADSICDRFPWAAPKVRLVHLGIGQQFRRVMDPDRHIDVRRKYSLPKRFVLYIGNIEPRKNLGSLVSAFEQVAERSDVDLVVGGAKAWRCEDIMRRLTCGPAAGRIHLAGHIAEADLPVLYSMSSLLVQWSLYEGVGLPPLEAMACGTPALVSDGGALAELAGQAAEILPLPDPAALADGILALLDDGARRRQIAADGQLLAERWTWAAHAQRLAAFYREVSGG